MQCNAMQRNATQRNAMQCNAIQCNATQRNAMQCDAMQCNAMQCNAMQCNAMQCNTIHTIVPYHTIPYHTILRHAHTAPSWDPSCLTVAGPHGRGLSHVHSPKRGREGQWLPTHGLVDVVCNPVLTFKSWGHLLRAAGLGC